MRKAFASALVVAGALALAGTAANAQVSTFTTFERTTETLEPVYIKSTTVQQAPVQPVIIHRTIQAPAVVAPVVRDPIIMTQPTTLIRDVDVDRHNLLELNLPFVHFGLF